MDRVAPICRRWKVARLEIFGSALRGDFDPARSDVDLLVTFEEGAMPSLLRAVRLEDELTEAIGRKVDLVVRRDIEESHNAIRRREILGTAREVYAASR
jgi:hypothetical protein